VTAAPDDPQGTGPIQRRVSRRLLVKGFGATVATSVGAVAVSTAGRGMDTPVAAAADDAVPMRSAASTVAVGSAGSHQTIRWTPALPWFDLTLDRPTCELALPAPSAHAAAEMQLILRQDSLGNRKVVWPSNVRSVGAIPALTTLRYAFDQFTLYSEDGVTWTLEGTVGGPSGSIDPLALSTPVAVFEARAQPLEPGTAVASAAPVSSLLDRGPLGRALVATTATPATYYSQAGPGSPWHRALHPGEAGFPRVQLAAGGVLSMDGLRAMNDYLLYYLVWFHTAQSARGGFKYLQLDNDSQTAIVASGNADNCWEDSVGYHNYTGEPGSIRDYSSIPLLGIVSVGAKSPAGSDAAYHRLNGVPQTFDVEPLKPVGLRGVSIGAVASASAVPTELDVLALGLIAPAPPLADVRRVEQWLAGLGGIRIRSS
jgi:hypothetical protein